MFSEQIKPITRELSKVMARGYNSYDVFEDWLDLMLCALTGQEEEYLKTVHRYRNDAPKDRREIDYFTNAFALLMTGMAKINEELLGTIYEEWNIQNKYRGQYFTPGPIAKMMAEINKPIGEEVSDPACGSGIMLIQSAKTMTNKELDKATFYGQDIDLTCVKMCALNMTFFNLNGYATCADTLLMEKPHKIYRTIRSYLGGSIIEIDPATIKTEEPKAEPKFLPVIRDDFKQASLFN